MRFARISLLLASVAISGLVLEVGFRVFDIRGHHADRVLRVGESVILDDADRDPGIAVQYRPNARFEIAYDSNPRGYFNERNAIEYQLNNHGFRGDDFAVKKPAGTLRVAVLGDSFTFGEGVRVEDTFASTLETRLASSLGRPVEVLNLGQSQWGTSDEIRYFARHGVTFEPDLVLVTYVLNDANYAGDLDLHNRFRSIYEPSGIVRKSYLLSYLQGAIGREVYGQLYVRSMLENSLEQQEQWDRSLRFLAKGRELADSVSANYGVVIFPFMYRLDDEYPFAVLHDRVRDFARQRAIPVFDLLPSMTGHRYTDLWVHPSDPHPNEKAHAIASSAIADFVLDAGLLRSGKRPSVRVAER